MKMIITKIAMPVLFAGIAFVAGTSSDATAWSTQGEWIVLFDGTDLSAWRNYKSDGVSPQWQIEDGVLVLRGEGGGDLITRQQFEDFELQMEWKISAGGNSGVFFHVAEADSLKRVYHSGPEIQILDNEGHKDGKIHTHRAGDNYDMQACVEETVRPVGTWNEMRIVVRDGHVEHHLNGIRVVEYDLWSPTWEAQLKASKFNKFPAYGRAKKGHIALQDHGDVVYFRNIRVREL